MEFGIYTDGILYDNLEFRRVLFRSDKNRVEKLSYTDVAFGTFTLSNISENLDRNRFDDMVMRAKKYIHDGDIFQVVLSRKFNFTAEGDFLKVYKILRQINPSPYRSEEHTSELQSRFDLVCRLL